MRYLAVVGVLALGCEDYGHFHRDLATPEVEDLAAPLVEDLANGVDAARPSDSAMPRDFATARDLTRPPDLALPSDLAALPDVAGPVVDLRHGAIPDLGADGDGMGKKFGPG